MTDAERAVRAFILERSRALAAHPSDEIDDRERRYLSDLAADLEADPSLLPVVDASLGRFMVYELQEHLHFGYGEEEADALYDRFVGEEEDDYRELYVPLEQPES